MIARSETPIERKLKRQLRRFLTLNTLLRGWKKPVWMDGRMQPIIPPSSAFQMLARDFYKSIGIPAPWELHTDAERMLCDCYRMILRHIVVAQSGRHNGDTDAIVTLCKKVLQVTRPDRSATEVLF